MIEIAIKELNLKFSENQKQKRFHLYNLLVSD